MPLKSETVDWIFARMTVRYGASWVAKWDGVPMDLVAADWARELDRMPIDALVYGMAYLPPDFPPTVTQFKDICNHRPEKPVAPPALEAPKADLERVHRLVSELREKLKLKKANPKQWAYKLKAREEAGEDLTMRQRECWRLALSDDEPTYEGYSTPIAIIENDQLPPGMRR